MRSAAVCRWPFALGIALLAGCAGDRPFWLYDSERRAAETNEVDAVVAADPGVETAQAPRPEAGLCPAPIEGTRIVKHELPDGLAFDLEASEPEDVERVRQSARDMAWLPGAPLGQRMDGHHSGMFAAGYIVPVTTITTVEAIPRGARITFRPALPSQLEALKQRAHSRAPSLPLGNCPVAFPRASG
jgi:hypothetical protein